MTSRVRNAGLVLLLVAALVAAFLAWFDWNRLKPYAERKVSEKTGREFRILGDLHVRLSLHPLIEADGLTLANAGWSANQPMLSTGHVAFRISLWPLLHGEVDLPEVTVAEPKVVLERRADGERNWIFDQKQTGASKPPRIGRLALDHGTLAFHDVKPDTHIFLDLTTSTGTDVKDRLPTAFSARGQLKGLRFTAKGRAGDVISLSDDASPFPIAGAVDLGTTHISVDGTITGIAVLSVVDLKFDLRGDDLSALYPLLGIALFPSPPYKLAGRLVKSGTQWEFRKFEGQVGDSDLGGDASYDTGGARPLLKGELVSRVLDLRDLAGLIGARRAGKPEDAPAERAQKAASAQAQRDRILPDQAFRLDRLRAMDADMKFTGKSIRNKELPVEHLTGHVKVDGGVMTLDPLDFAVAGGTVGARIVVDAKGEVPTGTAKVSFRKMQLPKLFPGLTLTKSSIGSIGGEMDLKGRGTSVGALLGSSNGRFALAMSSGEISNTLLEVIGLDGGEIMKFLFTGDRNVPLRCAVADFGVKDGVMNANTFVFDTTDTIVNAEGSMSLLDETLALELMPQPKDPSIFSLRSPLHLEGTFKHPKVRPDKALAARVGAAVVLGTLLTPLAALIPLIETGPGQDANCGALLASVQGAVAKAGPATPASPRVAAAGSGPPASPAAKAAAKNPRPAPSAAR